MRKENLFRNKATKGLVAALAVAMATTVAPVSADAASAKKVTIAKNDSVKKAGKKGSFKSNKPKVAKVNKNGKITAVKAGTAKITATTAKGKKVTYKVTVKKAPTISKKKVSVTAGNSKKVTINKNGASYLKVSFKSSNTGVATVNKNGKITGVSAGTATVTATVKGRNKNYKRKVTVTVNAATPTPVDPTPVDPTPVDPTPEAQDLVVTQGTNLVAGNYNTVTIKSSVPKDATVSLGAAKIGTLYVESGSEYNIDAVQADIDTIEIVGAGQATAKATRVPAAPRFNFGTNTALNKTKIVVKAAAYFAGTTKLGSISVSASVNLYVENAVGQLSVEGNAAKVSLHGAVDELTVKGESASVGVYAAVTTMKVEGKAATIMVAKSVVVTTMTISAENASVVGNGTVAELQVSAAGAVVKTAVTKATVDATVTTGAVIGGTTVSAGGTVSNVAAVGGQTDTDPVTTVTDGNSTNQGGTSNGSSGGSSSGTQYYTTPHIEKAFVNGQTDYIMVTAGTDTIRLDKIDLINWLKDKETNKTLQITINNSSTKTSFTVPAISGTTGSANSTSIVGVHAESATFRVGSYDYKIKVDDISSNSNADVALVEVTCWLPSNISSTTFGIKVSNTVKYSGVYNIKSGPEKAATIQYGTTTIKVEKEKIKAALNGDGKELGIEVNGIPATATLTDAIKSISSGSIVSYAYTPVGGPTFILDVKNVSGTTGNYTASFEVIVLDAANTTVTGSPTVTIS